MPSKFNEQTAFDLMPFYRKKADDERAREKAIDDEALARYIFKDTYQFKESALHRSAPPAFDPDGPEAKALADKRRQDQDLLVAAFDGDAAAISRLLTLGANPNVFGYAGPVMAPQDRRAQTPLMLAIRENHLDCVRILASASDLLLKTYTNCGVDGFTAMGVAILVDNEEALGILLDSSRDIPLVAKGNYHPLVFAALSNSPRCAAALLRSGRQHPNEPNPPGSGARDGLRITHPWGRLPDDEGITPLMAAAFYGAKSCVELLLPLSDLGLQSSWGDKPLPKSPALPLAAGAAPDARAAHAPGLTAAELAARAGHAELADLINAYAHAIVEQQQLAECSLPLTPATSTPSRAPRI